MKKLICFFLLSLYLAQGIAQSPVPQFSPYLPVADKLKTLKAACDSLTDLEKYSDVKIVARYALQLVPSTDLPNLALFNHYLGSSLENLTNRDSAIYYHEKSLSYAKEGNLSRRIRSSYQRLLFLYHSAGNEKKADNTALALQHILDTTTNQIWKYEILSFLGNYYNERAEYEKNVQYILSSIDIQKVLLKEGTGKVDTSDIGISYLNIAKAYIDMKQPEKALEYIAPSRVYLVRYVSGQTYYYKNYIDAWILLGQVNKALLHYDSLAAIVNTGAAGAFGWNDRLSADLMFADYYLSRNNTDSAWLFVGRANKAAPGKADDYLLSQINFMTGKVYAARKEYSKAIPLLKGAEEMTRNASMQVHASLLQTLAQAYAAVGNWQEAYKYYEKYAPLRDSLYTEASKKNIADAEGKFQNKEKQQQIENKNVQLAIARKQKIWLVAGLVLAGLVLTLLFVIYRNKKKTSDLLQEKNSALEKLNTDLEEANRTKAKLFSIISHDLRSPISQVYQFLKLQQLNPNLLNEEQKNELSNRIQTATGSLLETMEDLLLWSKTQMNEFRASMQPVQLSPVVETCKQLLQLNSEAKGISYQQHIDPIDTAHTDPYFLQTIVRNLLQNAIKASPQNGIIEIYTEKQEQHISLFIANAGEIFTQQQYLNTISPNDNVASINGLGLRLVDELSRKINAHIHFMPAANGATLVRINLQTA